MGSGMDGNGEGGEEGNGNTHLEAGGMEKKFKTRREWNRSGNVITEMEGNGIKKALSHTCSAQLSFALMKSFKDLSLLRSADGLYSNQCAATAARANKVTGALTRVYFNQGPVASISILHTASLDSRLSSLEQSATQCHQQYIYIYLQK
jgi:hypothetical protein